MKKFLYGVLIVIVLAALAAGAYWYCQKYVYSDKSDQSAATEVNFTKTGNLIKDNPGLKAGVWFLSYEQPGAPALSQELVFDKNSACKSGNKGIDCAQLVQGQRASVSGIQTGQVVLVKLLSAQTQDEQQIGIGMANPASVNCEDKGGKLEIITDKDGSQSGLCKFDDGSQCDEWAFFRGECKKGEIKK